MDATTILRLSETNQLTMPESIFVALPKTEFFQVAVDNGCIILTPVTSEQVHAIREKLEALGIDKQDVHDAIDWARTTK